jgi:hypothetical protein
MHETVKTCKNGAYIIYEKPNHIYRTLSFMLISKLSVNDCVKHVVLLLVMGHAVNTLYIYIHTYIHKYINIYIHTCMHAYIHAYIHTY